MKKEGFSLLELLVVIFIICILAYIALPQYRKAVATSELAQLINAIKSVSNAQERYFLINNKYSTSISGLDIDLIQSSKGITCSVTSDYNLCYNKNFVLAYYPSQTRHNYRMECYARNKNLIYACEKLFNQNASLTNSGPCGAIGGRPCYAVYTRQPI